MYITLQSTKRNLGLFNLEVADLIIGGTFSLFFVLFFALGFFEISIITILMGAFLLVPVSFSKKNRMYKLVLLTGRYLFSDKEYHYYKYASERRKLDFGKIRKFKIKQN